MLVDWQERRGFISIAGLLACSPDALANAEALGLQPLPNVMRLRLFFSDRGDERDRPSQNGSLAF
jgi:hypothetical protein